MTHIYRHYKGGEYRLIGFGDNAETGEEVVIYQSLTDDRLWVRSHDNFYEDILVEGKWIRRFLHIREE